MNILKGEIESITVRKNLSLVKVKVKEALLTAIVIDTPDSSPYLKEGHDVNVIFKETEVIVGSGTEHHISLQNKLIGQVETIERGDLLCKVVISTTAGAVTSIITANAISQLNITEGSTVTAMIKTNEMMLAE